MSMLNLNQSAFKDFKEENNNEEYQKLTSFIYTDEELKKIKIP
jgi:hypothetical protein